MDMHEDSAHIDGEPFLSYKAFTYATSNLHDKRFSEGEKRVAQIPRTHTDAINSSEHNEYKITTTSTTWFLPPVCLTITRSKDHASHSIEKRTAGSRLGFLFNRIRSRTGC